LFPWAIFAKKNQIAFRGHVPAKNSEKIFFGQLSCKIRAFSGKYNKTFGHFDNFSYIISGQKYLAPKVD